MKQEYVWGTHRASGFSVRKTVISNWLIEKNVGKKSMYRYIMTNIYKNILDYATIRFTLSTNILGCICSEVEKNMDGDAEVLRRGQCCQISPPHHTCYFLTVKLNQALNPIVELLISGAINKISDRQGYSL